MTESPAETNIKQIEPLPAMAPSAKLKEQLAHDLAEEWASTSAEPPSGAAEPEW